MESLKWILAHLTHSLSALSKKTMCDTSGNSAVLSFWLTGAAHYGCEETDQGPVPLYPIAHVLGSFGSTGKKLPLILPTSLSQERDFS